MTNEDKKIIDFLEVSLGDTVERKDDRFIIKEKKVRFCTECGKQHNTGIENRITGDFNHIDKYIDCLMSKCSFKLETTQFFLFL